MSALSALRPLPPRPSLEFERKEAKALLRHLRAGDPEALVRARTRHPAIDASDPARILLADAHLVIAREYGFTSWPRLVRYFRAVERQLRSERPTMPHSRDVYEGSVRGLLAEHRGRRLWTARALASYVPRLYGMRADEIFAAPITEDDARLAVARQSGFPSWDVLVERSASRDRKGPRDWEVPPAVYAGKAIAAADLAELRRVVEAHPDLLHPSDDDLAKGLSLIRSGLSQERRQGKARIGPIVEWLVAQGFDLERELNRQLCGHMYMRTEKVRWLLDRGADPSWVAPNGVPVLEHALIRYWNGEAVDLIAARTVPRRALWIAAGLGDVDGVRRSLDARGKPLPNAGRLRPEFDVAGTMPIPSHPDPDDEDLLMEAFFIAMLNGRTAVLEYMVSRGFPVNSLAWESPVIYVAVGNGMTSVTECLIRCGADLDLRGRPTGQSAREIARDMVENVNMANDPARRRIAELCGMDPDAILAERDARPVPPPNVAPKLQEAIEFAGDDAFRLGQSEIRQENLLFGLLRGGGLPLDVFTKYSRMELERFRADVWDRVHPNETQVDRPKLPLDADAQAMVQSAIAIATKRRQETVNPIHLLYALFQAERGPAAELLTRYGSNAAIVNEVLDRVIS